MKIENVQGLIAAVLAWLVIEVFQITSDSCSRFNNCGSSNLFLSNVIAVGMLAPAYFFGAFVSIFFDKHKSDED